jgi:hypothetical protein
MLPPWLTLQATWIFYSTMKVTQQSHPWMIWQGSTYKGNIATIGVCSKLEAASKATVDVGVMAPQSKLQLAQPDALNLVSSLPTCPYPKH